jgi:hypothetical protein
MAAIGRCQVALATDWDAIHEMQSQMSDMQWGMELDRAPLVAAVRRARGVCAADANMPVTELQGWLSQDFGLSPAGKEAALTALDYAINYDPAVASPMPYRMDYQEEQRNLNNDGAFASPTVVAMET